jgi:tRNA G18 (ribose-2'-O)-methylase SpoU
VTSLPISLTDPDDPRLADYRHLKDRDLSAQGGRFVAEGELVVRRLLASRLTVHSLLLTPPRLATLGDIGDRPGCLVFLANQAVMDAIAGFHVHRGCLAIGERGAEPSVPPDARTLVIVEDLVSADNLGACVRNATAFGAEALVLSPRAADPFYRKAIRVALGSTFELPIVRLRSWPADLLALKSRLGLTLVATVLDPAAVPLSQFRRPARVGLLLGSEGPGLSPAARAACDVRLTIPMSPGADSLNVATAAAIALYHLQQVSEPSSPSPSPSVPGMAQPARR